MPVEISRAPERTVRRRFVRNASYGGVDYGPDCPEQEADVRLDWARSFDRRGVTVPVDAAPAVEAEPVGPVVDGDALPQGEEEREPATEIAPALAAGVESSDSEQAAPVGESAPAVEAEPVGPVVRTTRKRAGAQ